jgi:RimJ/RimL family protein N-acetyltransferase
MELEVRTATFGDMESIYHLSNDPEIRQVSYSQAQIPYEDHVRWFTGKLHDRNCIFLVILDEGKFIGQVRLMCSGDTAEISISISKEYRSKGAGKAAMHLAIGYMRVNTEIREIHAFVKKSNPISVAYFERCGFMRTIDQVVLGVPSIEFVLQIDRPKGRTL